MNIAVIYIIILPRGTPTPPPFFYLLLIYVLQKMKPNPILFLSFKQFGSPSRLVSHNICPSVTHTVALWERLTTAAEPGRVQQRLGYRRL